MKCVLCGGTVKKELGDHKYCENDGIKVLLVGVTHEVCQKCGDRSVVIPAIEKLDRMIVKGFTKKEGRLTGGEIRFLRKHLGWSGVDFASRMGVTPETVSRWENGKKPMGEVAERLLRTMALYLQRVDKYPLPDKLTTKKSPAKLKLTPAARGGASASWGDVAMVAK